MYRPAVRFSSNFSSASPPPRDRNHLAGAQFSGPSLDDLAPGVIEGRPITRLQGHDQRLDKLKALLFREGQDGAEELFGSGGHRTFLQHGTVVILPARSKGSDPNETSVTAPLRTMAWLCYDKPIACTEVTPPCHVSRYRPARSR